MIVNLEQVLKEEKVFPPKSEIKRLDKYKIWKAIFEGRFMDAFPNLHYKIGQVVKTEGRDGVEMLMADPYIVNFSRTIIKKFADLSFGLPPSVVVLGGDDGTDDKISKVLVNSNIWSTFAKIKMDCDLYGNGIIKTYKKEEEFVQSSENGDEIDRAAAIPIQPKMWFIEVNPRNMYDVKSHVVGWVTNYGTLDSPDYRLYMEIHKKGSGEWREYKVDEPYRDQWTIVDRIDGGSLDTNLTNNAIQSFIGFASSEDGLEGQSILEDIADVLENIVVRLTQINTVLDKHVMPTLLGPSDIAEKDPSTQRRFIKLGKFIALSSNVTAANKPTYLEWDGKLDSAFEMVDKSIAYLYQLAETGSAMLDHMGSGIGFAESAKAMTLRHKSPISKTNAWLMHNRINVLQAISNILELAGINVSWTQLEFGFNINLPDDPFQKAQEFVLLNRGRSARQLYREMFGMNAAGAEEEFEAMVEEKRLLTEAEGKGKVGVTGGVAEGTSADARSGGADANDMKIAQSNSPNRNTED